MFNQLKRVVYRANDVEKARNWYMELLQQEPAFDSPVASIFKIGNSTMSLAGSSEHPMVYWEVDDVDQSFDQLLKMGAAEKVRPQNQLSIRTAQVVDPFGNVIGLTGKIKGDDNQTAENQASHTAHSVALCRALASRDTRFGVRTSDPYSEFFLNENIRPVFCNETARNTLIDTRISRPLYGYLLARSAFMDEVFLRAVQGQIPQIVFLGAGYDTRSLRFQERLGAIRIYELDVPTTQRRKRECLNAAATAMPSQVTFVEANFRTESFLEKLEEAGFNRSLPALYIWEGVTYYLSQDTVNRTFDMMQAGSAAGTGVCFDYATKELDSLSAGEPLLSWINAADIEEYLNQYNFRLQDHLDSAAMTARYLTQAKGTPAEKPFSALRLAYAERE
jgi:methyltransferase (TIGR00027 family)